jgi:hypothetical protein
VVVFLTPKVIQMAKLLKTKEVPVPSGAGGAGQGGLLGAVFHVMEPEG